MRQPYRLLTLVLLLCAVAAAVGAFVLLHSSHKANVAVEVGRWLLTVAVALVLTGAVSMIVKQIDQRRIEREAWHTVLNDLVAADQTVMLGRFRLQAHKSALTYQKELAEFMSARVELRRICAIGIVIGDRRLRDQISAMREYLDALAWEYDRGYLCVARQQRLDELWLTDQIKAVKDGADVPVLPALLAEPTKAWGMLQDHKQFPRLAALLDPYAFPIDTFRTNYKLAKSCLEIHAGIEARSMAVLKDSAGKLTRRTNKFMAQHADLPAEIKTLVSQKVNQVEEACAAQEPLRITDAMAELTKETSAAIRAVYPPSEPQHHQDGEPSGGGDGHVLIP